MLIQTRKLLISVNIPGKQASDYVSVSFDYEVDKEDFDDFLEWMNYSLEDFMLINEIEDKEEFYATYSDPNAAWDLENFMLNKNTKQTFKEFIENKYIENVVDKVEEHLIVSLKDLEI